MTLWLAAAAGLLGSAHCIGMCGGLVSSCFLRLGPGARRAGAHAAYHAARLGVYVIVGGLAGFLGEALTRSGRFGLAQGVLQILAGLVVIVMGLDVLGRFPFSVAIGLAPASWPQTLVRQALSFAPVRASGEPSPPPVPSSSLGPDPSGSPPAVPWRPMLLMGAANGLMPCSLTLSIAVQAATAKSAASGALLMAAFGAGTLPAMLAVGSLFARLSHGARRALLTAAAVLVILMGALQIWQGLVLTRIMAKLVL